MQAESQVYVSCKNVSGSSSGRIPGTRSQEGRAEEVHPYYGVLEGGLCFATEEAESRSNAVFGKDEKPASMHVRRVSMLETTRAIRVDSGLRVLLLSSGLHEMSWILTSPGSMCCVFTV